MMNDAQHRLLYDYLEGSLSNEERVALERELESSEELRAELAMKRAIMDAIQEEGRDELRGFLKERLFEESTDKQTGLWLVAAATVATLIVSTLIISGQFGQGGFLKTKAMVESEMANQDSDLPPSRIKKYRRKNEPSALSELDSVSILDPAAVAMMEVPDETHDMQVTENSDRADMAAPNSAADDVLPMTFARVKVIDLGYAEIESERPSSAAKRSIAAAGQVASAELAVADTAVRSQPVQRARSDRYAKVEFFSTPSSDDPVPTAPPSVMLVAGTERSYHIFNAMAENYLVIFLNGTYYLSMNNEYYSLPSKANVKKPLTRVEDVRILNLLEQSE
jgi:hypothetical protein